MSAAQPRREVYTEVPLEDGTLLAKGDEICIRGEPSATFIFRHLAVNPSGHQAVSCHGGTPGRGMWRAFTPDRVLVRKGRKGIRLAEYGDGNGEPDDEAEQKAEELVEAAKVAAREKNRPDIEMEVRSQDRRPERGAQEGALAAQVADGRVRPGTELRHGEHRCTVTLDGWFEVAGERYSSPSTAAKHCLGGRSPNGWVWWRLPDGRKLEAVR